LFKLNQIDKIGTIHFLDEAKRLTSSLGDAKSFIYKTAGKHGFSEFFGVIVDSDVDLDAVLEENVAKSNIYKPLHGAAIDALNAQYNLDKKYTFNYKDKSVSIYVPDNFLRFTPHTWYGVDRKLEYLANQAAKRQKNIYDFYKQNLHVDHIHTLAEVKATSVAWMYFYLHDESERWSEGFERFGYVDGLWETGGYLSIAIDSGAFRLHTSVHELGHSMSYYLNDDFFNEWINIARDTKEEPATDYGKTDIAEDFAESYGFYFGGKTSRGTLKKTCPQRFSYMEKLEHSDGDCMNGLYSPTTQLSKRFRKFDEVIYEEARNHSIQIGGRMKTSVLDSNITKHNFFGDK
jgi:hypothetical protein